MEIDFVTSNLGPFRIDWLDELSKSCKVNIYYNDDVVKNVNKQYISRRPKIAKYRKITRKTRLGIKFFDFRNILQSNSNLLILDGYGFFSQIILILLLSILKRNFILNVDGGLLDKNESKVKYKFKKFIITRAKYYLSTSIATDEYLLHYGANVNNIFRHKLSSVYNKDIREQIVSDLEKKILREKYNLSNQFTLIAVGKFINIKGFDILLKSLRYIDEDVQVLIVGGTEHEEYSSIIDKYNLRNIKFFDFMDKEELFEFYDLSDVFVLPTRGDVWGLVINEAMSRGLPIITTTSCVAGISLIENYINGFLIPPENEVLLADKIEIIRKNKEITEKIKENNLKKIKEYSIERIAIDDIITLQEIIHREE